MAGKKERKPATKACRFDEHGACCCTCRYRLDDYSHPLTDGRPCTEQRGYICNNPELGAYSGWSEHGLCECHQPASGSHPIFRDFYSKDMWQAVNGAKSKEDLRHALYFVCCRIQELEERMEAKRP